jgi:HD-like signal output (HDOD) protein
MHSPSAVASTPGVVAPIPLDQDRMHAICRRLPPFPPLASQLIAMFSRPDADLHEAVALIRSDAVFSGELLRLANSAEFASYEPFEDATRAVLYLGFERVQSAIRRITYARLMKDSFNHPFNAEIHRNNMATAFLCDRLMSAYGNADDLEDFCPYSLGLYLKIGALVLLRGFPRDYPRFLTTRASSEQAMLSTEKALFGFRHVEISTHLVKHWEFPEAFQDLVAGHTADISFSDPLRIEDAARIAGRMAGSLGFAFQKGLAFPDFEELVEKLPKEGNEAFSRNPEEWKAQIAAHLDELMFKS